MGSVLFELRKRSQGCCLDEEKRATHVVVMACAVQCWTKEKQQTRALAMVSCACAIRRRRC
jgi:hypothetical protein